jgi:hypothetical protein
VPYSLGRILRAANDPTPGARPSARELADTFGDRSTLGAAVWDVTEKVPKARRARPSSATLILPHARLAG